MFIEGSVCRNYHLVTSHLLVSGSLFFTSSPPPSSPSPIRLPFLASKSCQNGPSHEYAPIRHRSAADVTAKKSSHPQPYQHTAKAVAIGSSLPESPSHSPSGSTWRRIGISRPQTSFELSEVDMI